jgi:hypothetical protein
MRKFLIVLLADIAGHENTSRGYHALLYTKEIHDKKMDVKLVFDGAGTQWALKLAKGKGGFNKMYVDLKDKCLVLGACLACSKAFGVEEELRALGEKFVDEYEGHPDTAKYIADGYELVII